MKMLMSVHGNPAVDGFLCNLGFVKCQSCFEDIVFCEYEDIGVHAWSRFLELTVLEQCIRDSGTRNVGRRNIRILYAYAPLTSSGMDDCVNRTIDSMQVSEDENLIVFTSNSKMLDVRYKFLVRMPEYMFSPCGGLPVGSMMAERSLCEYAKRMGNSVKSVDTIYPMFDGPWMKPEYVGIKINQGDKFDPSAVTGRDTVQDIANSRLNKNLIVGVHNG
jgi:hypothetical protein